MEMGYMDLAFQHISDSDIQILCDSQDPEHIQAHNQWLYQAWELDLAHTWTQIMHASFYQSEYKHKYVN